MAEADTTAAHNRLIFVVVILFLPGNKVDAHPKTQSAKGETGFAPIAR
jgi:hypothetical protein